jgi:hypothetical protein
MPAKIIVVEDDPKYSREESPSFDARDWRKRLASVTGLSGLSFPFAGGIDG